MSQTLLICWKERKDEVVVVELAHSLSWWDQRLQSHPCTPPGQGLLCDLCHIALTAVTGQCAANSVPDWSRWSADSRLGPGRSSEEGAQGSQCCQSCLVGSACAYTSVGVTEQCMSHKTLHIFS